MRTAAVRRLRAPRRVAAWTGVAVALSLLPAPHPADASPTPASVGARSAECAFGAAHRCAPPRRAGVRGHLAVPLDPADPGAGSLRVGYELHRATGGRSVGTIVAIEGGPGYATTGSRDYYLDLFAPLLDRRDLLLIDARGTGTSGALNCPQLQAYRGDYATAVLRCGRLLGDTSDLYGSAFAADDIARVLDHLGLRRVDVYGDSYGTFLGQTFALRHPDRVRTLTLDAAYPVEGLNPWYPDLNRALRGAFRLVCRRDAQCRAGGGDPVRFLGGLADALRADPLVGRAYDADGARRTVRVDHLVLAELMGTATYGTTVYRELVGAGRAWLRRGDPQPLLRIAAEQTFAGGGAGPVRAYSEAAYLAVICNDYPQLWDISSPIAARPAQLDGEVARLRRNRPRVFAPFTVAEWLASGWTDADSCLNWPVPDRWVPPVTNPVYPDVPTLVLVGDLDSITSAEGSRNAAARFPRASVVEVANTGHVTALGDPRGCAAGIVVRFVATRSPGDTSCAREYPRVRTVERFPRALRGVVAGPGRGSERERRVAAAVAATVGDLFPRWFAMYGTRGRGLRGGTFTTTGLVEVGFDLRELRLVREVAVSGHLDWDRRTGKATAVLTFRGAATGRLRLAWDDDLPRGNASGVIDGRRGTWRILAP